MFELNAITINFFHIYLHCTNKCIQETIVCNKNIYPIAIGKEIVRYVNLSLRFPDEKVVAGYC